MVFLGTTHHLGEGLYLTPGQLGTLQCLAKTQKWSFTARKLLVMLYPDDYLKERCAVGKKGCKNMAMNMEELGILKGKLLHHSIADLRLIFSDRIHTGASSW